MASEGEARSARTTNDGISNKRELAELRRQVKSITGAIADFQERQRYRGAEDGQEEIPRSFRLLFPGVEEGNKRPISRLLPRMVVPLSVAMTWNEYLKQKRRKANIKNRRTFSEIYIDMLSDNLVAMNGAGRDEALLMFEALAGYEDEDDDDKHGII